MQALWDEMSVPTSEQRPKSGLLQVTVPTPISFSKKISTLRNSLCSSKHDAVACFPHTRSFTITTTLYLESAQVERRRLYIKAFRTFLLNGKELPVRMKRQWHSRYTTRAQSWCLQNLHPLSPYCKRLNLQRVGKTPTRGAPGTRVPQINLG